MGEDKRRLLEAVERAVIAWDNTYYNVGPTPEDNLRELIRAMHTLTGVYQQVVYKPTLH